jgi:hypothetical protein
MIRIGDVNVRPEHILVTDLNQAAGVNHDIPVEVIAISNPNSNSGVLMTIRPKPATLRKGIVRSDLDLGTAADSSVAFHPVVFSGFHSERTINS